MEIKNDAKSCYFETNPCCARKYIDEVFNKNLKSKIDTQNNMINVVNNQSFRMYMESKFNQCNPYGSFNVQPCQTLRFQHDVFDFPKKFQNRFV